MFKDGVIVMISNNGASRQITKYRHHVKSYIISNNGVSRQTTKYRHHCIIFHHHHTSYLTLPRVRVFKIINSNFPSSSYIVFDTSKGEGF